MEIANTAGLEGKEGGDPVRSTGSDGEVMLEDDECVVEDPRESETREGSLSQYVKSAGVDTLPTTDDSLTLTGSQTFGDSASLSEPQSHTGAQWNEKQFRSIAAQKYSKDRVVGSSVDREILPLSTGAVVMDSDEG